MPLIKSAIKKMRKDAKRTKHNKIFKTKLRGQIKDAVKKKSPESTKKAISIIDKAVKKNILKKNTAARMKSKLMRSKEKAIPKKEVAKRRKSKK